MYLSAHGYKGLSRRNLYKTRWFEHKLVERVCLKSKKYLSLRPVSKKHLKNKTYNKEMKKGIHPEYRNIVFWDLSNDYKFVTRSCAPTKETIEFEGTTYPVFKVEVSSQSHPFYTGKNTLLDTAGRVDKFMKKYGKK
jgi:large subunit ribosomal protein L31